MVWLLAASGPERETLSRPEGVSYDGAPMKVATDIMRYRDINVMFDGVRGTLASIVLADR